jgi:hypothetical protein
VRRAAVVLIAFLSLTAGASAATATAAEPVGQTWVRVNACGGGSMGVRAAQPGDALDRPMTTRFSAQWLDGAGVWRALPGSESPWLMAGPGRWLTSETGWTRTFAAGAPGQVFTLRGVVEMRWLSASGGVANAATLVTPQTCTLR